MWLPQYYHSLLTLKNRNIDYVQIWAAYRESPVWID